MSSGVEPEQMEWYEAMASPSYIVSSQSLPRTRGTERLSNVILETSGEAFARTYLYPHFPPRT